MALATFGAASLACPARADELTGTLKKIHDDGVVVLGVREASIPFSYFDGKHTIGYSQTIALQIVDEIRKTLGMPQLKVHEITVTSSNRTPMLQNNQIDLECGSTTHTVERENVAAFSNSFFQYAVRMITRKNSGITDFADLAGKPVVTTAGTSDERLLRRLNTDKHLNMRITSARDHLEAFTALKEDRAVAFVMDEPIVYGFRATDPRPDDFVVTGTPLGSEVYACMFRKGDEPFRNLVNGVIARGADFRRGGTPVQAVVHAAHSAARHQSEFSAVGTEPRAVRASERPRARLGVEHGVARPAACATTSDAAPQATASSERAA